MKAVFANRILISFLFILGVLQGISQTNPTAQTLPYTQDFGTSTYTTLPAGMAGWNGINGGATSTQTLAEASTPSGNATVAAATGAVTGGGMYGYALGGNAKAYIQTSSNATNGVNQLALAINTTGSSNVNVTYDIDIISAQPRTVGVVLQYRIGTSGTWTSVTGTNSPASQAGGSSGFLGTASLTLPSSCDNQAIVQLRWAIWRGTQSGNSSGIAIDNISINSGSACPIPTSPAIGSISSSGANFSWTAPATPPAVGYEYEVRSSGLPGSGSSGLVSSGAVTGVSATITGLSASTNYNAYVRSDCGSSLFSTWTSATNFTTTAGTASISVTPASPSAYTTTYGTASSSQTFSVSGSSLTTDITVTAPSGFEVSTNGTSWSSSVNYTPAGGNVAGTLHVRLTSLCAPGTYNNQNVSLSSVGATTFQLTTTSSGNIVAQAPLTISSASANSKPYDGNTNAFISGTLVGVIGTDNVLIGNGIFSSPNVGTNIPVSSVALTGTDASKYLLTQPAGLSADITMGSQTISFTLVGSTPLSTGTITLNGSANSGLSVSYSSSNTSVATVSGNILTLVGTGTVDITASQGGNANYNPATNVVRTLVVSGTASLTDVIMPQFIQGLNGTNSNRVPYAFRATLSGLNANATYRYNVGMDTCLVTNPSNFGAGIGIYPGSSIATSFLYATTQSLNTTNQYGTFTSDATGNYTGWFIIMPSGNVRFTPGNLVHAKIVLNDGAGGTTLVHALKSNQTVQVINFGTSTSDGTGIYGASFATDKNFVTLYDNGSGSGRPIACTYIQDGGAALPTSTTASFYQTDVMNISGAWGTIIPNNLPNGIRRIEQRSFANGQIEGCPSIDDNGVWSSAVNTVNPVTGGVVGGATPTALKLLNTDAPLTDPVITLASTTQSNLIEQCTDGSGWVYYGNGAGTLFAIHKTTNTFTPSSVEINVGPISTPILNISASQSHQMFLMARRWNVECNSCNITNPVAVRFYYDPIELDNAKTARDNAYAALGSSTGMTTSGTTAQWFKTIGVPFNATYISNILGNWFPGGVVKFGVTAGTNATITSVNASLSFVELSGIPSFSGGTGGFSFGVQNGGGANGLPVKWGEIRGEASEAGNEISWTTATEVNTSHFILEFSHDGIHFFSASKPIAAAGSSQESQKYTTWHFDNHAKTYYRIKLINNDGSEDYSETIAISRNIKNTPFEASIYPIPATNNALHIEIINSNSTYTFIDITDLQGRLILKKELISEQLHFHESIDLSSIESGQYICEIRNGSETKRIRIYK